MIPSNPVAVVTGASSGIGRALAFRLAARGYAVGLLARRRRALEEAAAHIADQGGRALVLPGDVRDAARVREHVQTCERELGPVVLAVANAGIGHPTPAAALDVETVRAVLDVNLLGAVHLFAAVLPGMIARRRGHLVGISSLAGFRGLPEHAAYCASKAALTVFMESLRLDLRGTGIRVTVIHPGFVKTPMTANNPHPMPFLQDLDGAAGRILRAIDRRRRLYAFPFPLAALARLAHWLPAAWYDRLIPRGRTIQPPASGPAEPP